MVYWLTRNLARLMLHLLFGFRVVDAHKIPREGPVMLAANHFSLLDPIAVGASLPRRITFMARSEPFRMPVLSWLLPRLGVIPVDRGASDITAIKAAIRTLEAGKTFGIFPEGTRGRDGKLKPFKTGAAAIALRTGATIVPVGVVGSYEAWPAGKKIFFRRPVTVVFGDPIAVDKQKADREILESLTLKLQDSVQQLLPLRNHAASSD